MRLRAYGSYSIRVADARLLLEELVSTDGLYQTDEISDHIRNMIVSAFCQLGRQRPDPRV